MPAPATLHAEMQRLTQAIVDARSAWYRDRRELLQPEGTGHRQTMVVPTRWGHRSVLAIGLACTVAGLVLHARGIPWGLSLLPVAAIAALNGWARWSGYRKYRAAHAAFARAHDPQVAELAELHATHASTFHNAYVAIAGTGTYRPHLLIHRHHPDLPDEVVSWVLRKKGPSFTIEHRVAGRIAGMWRAAFGPTWLAGDEGVIALRDNTRGQAPIATHLDACIVGVWGLSDDFVLAWGTSPRGDNALFRYDGERWAAMPAPPAGKEKRRTLRTVHGTGPDQLLAGGEGGLLSRWDGERWRRAKVPSDRAFCGVHVESVAEMYAVAGPCLFERSSEGWTSMLAELPEPDYRTAAGPGRELHDVAKFAGQLWVAAGEGGLCQCHGDELTVIMADRHVKRLTLSHDGKTLLAVCDDAVGATADGETWQWLRQRDPVDV
ncbi:MAG: hypothetical protein RIF41_13260 [Polyangiaceae bacterium]